MGVVPRSRDGHKALLRVVGALFTAIALWVGIFAVTSYLVDSGDRDVRQTQAD